MKFQEKIEDAMIEERKPFGTIDSNITRVQPTRAAKTGHKWLAHRHSKPDESSKTLQPQLLHSHTTCSQHFLLKQSRNNSVSAENVENNNSLMNEISNRLRDDSFGNLRQSDNYAGLSYQNKNNVFRLPLQTLSFNPTNELASNSQSSKAAPYSSTIKNNNGASTGCSDSDVSLRSVSEEDCAEGFLSKLSSRVKLEESAICNAGLQSKTVHYNVEILDEYLTDILSYMRSLEVKYKPKRNYLEKQTEITSLMRVKLIDWLVEVQAEYKLLNETLYLAVAFVDRFLSEMSVTRTKLQLLGTASMFLAAKFEEIYPPDANEFAYVTADTYTRSEVLLMERMILKVFNYTLAMPTTFQYLTVFLEKSNLNENVRYLSYYVAEMTLLDEKYLAYLPSVKAAAALTLAICTERYSHYIDIANGNSGSQESVENMYVDVGSQNLNDNRPECIFCASLRSVMSTSIDAIFRCVQDMAKNHLSESSSTSFVREKYMSSSQKSSAMVTPLLADSSENASCFLSLYNITNIWT